MNKTILVAALLGTVVNLTAAPGWPEMPTRDPHSRGFVTATEFSRQKIIIINSSSSATSATMTGA